MKHLLASLLLIVTTMQNPAHAGIYGEGNVKCKSLLEYKSNAVFKDQFQSWISGFLTGYTQGAKDTIFELNSKEELDDFFNVVVKECRRDSKATVNLITLKVFAVEHQRLAEESIKKSKEAMKNKGISK